MKLCTNNKTCVLLNIWYGGKTIEEVEKNKFFGVQIDSNFSRKSNIPRLAIMTVTLLVKIELKLFPVHDVTQNNSLGEFFGHQEKEYDWKNGLS